VNNSAYQGRVDLEIRVEQLEDQVLQSWSGLHQAIVELIRLRNMVNTSMTRLAVYEHGRGNQILVKDLPEPGLSRRSLLPEGHPHQLVPIEDLVGLLDGESLELQSVFDEDREVEETAVTSRESSPVL
jgi:hypothetical protein